MNSNSFDIPFTIERTGAQPVEVQLFVSRDRGRSWKFFARQPANEKGFPFEASEEGGFWFATRTIDARGVSYPTGPMKPQLEVVVDTTSPKIEANINTDTQGGVYFDYVISDAAADPTNLRLEYMTDAVRQWLPIAIQGNPGVRPQDGAYVGRITWQPQTQWRHLYARMLVRDRAGNQTVINKQVEKPRVAEVESSLASAPPQAGFPGHLASGRPTFGHPPANGNTQSGAAPYQPPMPTRDVAPSYPPAHAQHFTNQQPISQHGVQASQPNYALPYPSQQPNAGNRQQMPVMYPNQPNTAPEATRLPNVTYHQPGIAGTFRGAAPPVGRPVSTSMGLNAPLQNQPNAPAGSSANPTGPAETLVTSPQPDQSALANSNTPQEPVNPNQALRPLDQTAQNTLPPAAEKPTPKPNDRALTLNDTPRVTRSKQFSLDYEVDSIGNGGVEAVELWGTRDGGTTWNRWNADPDKQSPFDIEVSREGLVGFKIVVVAANGLSTPKPQPGEAADIYILVDTTAPRARITGATYGQGQQAGSLVIDYACHDDNFGDRPISLAFSDKPEGKWTTIATGLANTGRYVWPADPNLPREIYLRVEAKDKAGNFGVQALDVPVSVQGLAPQGRIRGFETIDGANSNDAVTSQAAAPRARFR